MLELAAVGTFVAVTAAAAVVVLGAVWFAVTYALYIAVMLLDQWRTDNPDNELVRLITFVLLVPLVLVGWPLDAGFNWTYGLALGVTPDATLSSKLQYIRRVDRGERLDTYGIVRPWRVAVANFICGRLLNPFERDGHC